MLLAQTLLLIVFIDSILVRMWRICRPDARPLFSSPFRPEEIGWLAFMIFDPIRSTTMLAHDVMAMPDVAAQLEVISTLAAKTLGVRLSMVTHVRRDEHRQVIMAGVGLPKALARDRQTPLNESICRFVLDGDNPLAIPDLRIDYRTALNPLVQREGLGAYAGAPIHASCGSPVGAICAIGGAPTAWREDQLRHLVHYAALVDRLISDRTMLLQQEQQVQRLRAKMMSRSGFLTHLSHEIRTPMTGIVGAIRLLNHRSTQDRAEELIALLNRSAQRLMQVLNDTLDLARLDAGLLPDAVTPCDLGKIARDVLKRHADDVGHRPVDLRCTDRLGGRRYLAHAGSLDLLMNNLFSNAVKFTDTGFAEILLFEDQSGRVVIRVIDSGIGMGEDDQRTLFEEFAAASEHVPRKGGGTGLGMAIIRRLVELMDGTISVVSHPQIGTTITVSLPLAPATDADEAPALQ
jgi:signal transduction histidine kinase